MKEPFNCNHDRVITVNHIIIITITDRLSPFSSSFPPPIQWCNSAIIM